MGLRKPIPSPPRRTLTELRFTLGRLERTGDPNSPSIANLRRIVLAQIAELEAAKASAK
jgi:hypothetical protein